MSTTNFFTPVTAIYDGETATQVNIIDPETERRVSVPKTLICPEDLQEEHALGDEVTYNITYWHAKSEGLV